MAGYTITNPVKWSTVVTSLNVVAGDTLILKDGTYLGLDVNVVGSTNSPVVIKPLNPGQVTIDGAINFNGTYLEVYDINFTDSNPERYAITNGVFVSNSKVSFYGCIFSDQHSSGLNWFGSGVGEVCECVFLNNGYILPDESYHGHGLYTHNNLGGLRVIARNI